MSLAKHPENAKQPSATVRACAIIPVYNHGATVGAVVSRLRSHGLPCLLIDDGSEPGCAHVLDELAQEGRATLLRRPENGGKGAAVMDGLRAALAQGYTHALQVDADGQHALDDTPAFLAAAQVAPTALIAGEPRYSDDMPAGRRYGRLLTRAWVWINTWSTEIPDAMCGFRLYPLIPVNALLARQRLGRRMDFDIEILVRLHWLGLPMVWLPTAVRYPEGGISHFHMVRDNLRISAVHARLFAGMLWRSPALLWRRLRGRSR